MSESTQEKMAHALQDQHEQWRAFASKALEGSTKLFELNLKMARQTMQDATQAARHLLSAKSPEEIFTLDQKGLQDRVNKIMAFNAEINEIVMAYGMELGQSVQTHIRKPGAKIEKAIADIGKSAHPQQFLPQMDDFTHGFEQWLSATKQLSDAFGQGTIAAAKPATVRKTAARPVAKKAVAAKPAARKARAR